MAVDTAAPPQRTVADLGRKVKKKYPGYAARYTDVELGRKVVKKYPAYAKRYVDVSDAVAPGPAAPTPAATPAPVRGRAVEPAPAEDATQPTPSVRQQVSALRVGPAPAEAGPGSPPEFIRGFRGGLVGQSAEAAGRTLQAAADVAPVGVGPGGAPGPLEGVRRLASRAGGALVRAGQGQAQAPKVGSFKDIRSASELFDYLQFQAGQGIASTIPPAAGGAAGFAVAGPPGAVVGAAAPSYALNFGDVAQEVDAALPGASAAKRAQIAAIIALPVTALDVIPSVRFGTKAAKKLMVQKVLREAAKRGLIERVAKEGFKGALSEGITEALQETIQALSVAGAAGKEVGVDEMVTRAVDAAIGGALAGGGIGGAVEALPQKKAGPVDMRPSVSEAAAARANVEEPRGLSAARAGVARQASIDLQNTIVQMQHAAPGPIRFEADGLVIEDAHIIPSLVRVFPGDANPLRVTVVDRANGRMHSLALPSIGSLKDAMSVESRAEPVPDAEAPAERLLPPEGSQTAPEPEQVRAASVGAKERAVARAEEQAKAPARIAELQRQVAENPGDKRVRQWKRRIGRLQRQLPGRAEKLTPSTPKEAPKVLARPVAPEEEKKPAPTNLSAEEERLAQTRTWVFDPGRSDRTAQLMFAEGMRRVPKERRALIERRAEEIQAAPKPPRAAPAPARPAQPQEPPVSPAPAPSGTEAGGAAEARPRAIAPDLVFGDEATARRVAVSLARSSPAAEPKVVKTRKGYQIEVNEDAAESRLKKQDFSRPAAAPAPKAAPAPAPEPAPATRGEPAAVPEGQGKGAAPAKPKKALPQTGLGGEVGADFALEPPQAGRAKPSGRTFTDEFEDLARQGMSLEEATAEAKARSGGEPPAGLDLDARWSRVRREAQESAGQTDMFGGAAMLGGGEPGVVSPETPAEREAPPTVSEATPRAEKPSEAIDVPLEGLWYWEGFQNRDVARNRPPTQDPGELVNAAHVRMLGETRGGFDIDEVVRRPILVWRDVAGEVPGGVKGARYVIDGHHRSYMGKQAGAKKLPAVEVFGNLEYAKKQAETANMASVPNTFSEQARIAREIRERGDSWERVAAQLRVRGSRAKAMVDFAHLDPSVRSQYFPSGNENALLNGTAHGETIGKYAKESPDLMPVNVQRQWLDQAVNDGTKPTLFAEQVREWHALMTAAKQETIDLGGGGKGLKLSMTPKQFAETSGRLIGAIEAQKRQVNAIAKSLENVAEMARDAGHRAALEFTQKKLVEVEAELKRLVAAKKKVEGRVRDAVVEGMRGGADLSSSLDAIQKEVDQIVGPKADSALTGEEGFIRIPELLEAIRRAIARLSGIARRDPVAKRAAKAPTTPAVVDRILEALRGAKPKREAQEAGYTAEMGKRVRLSGELEQGKSGMERHRARRRSMAGALPQVDFESIAGALSQENIDSLVNIIYSHPGIDFFEQANAVDALEKLIGERGGVVPQRHELELLEIVFGTEFVETVTDLRPQVMTLREKLYAIGHISRTMRTSYDMSGPLRQGLYLAPSYPREWSAAFVAMHRYWASEEAFREGMEEVARRPSFKLMRRSGLSITRPGSRFIDAQEEAFIGAKLLSKIPGVRRSDRAYAGFLNKLRADVFDALVGLAEANGRDPWQDAKLASEIAQFVNAATGRGDSKFITEHAAGLNAIFFAPRLIKSRLHLLNPKHYVAGDPFIRRKYIESTLALSGAATMVLTLAAWAGARVEWERLNADWGKIRVGGQVYDVLGGLVQYIRLYPAVAEALWDQMSGRKRRYGTTAQEMLYRFAEHKLSPIASFTVDWLRGWKLEESGRRKLTYRDLPSDVLSLFVPMIAEDFFEVMKKDPRQLPGSIPAAFYGVSVQSYQKPKPARRKLPAGIDSL